MAMPAFLLRQASRPSGRWSFAIAWLLNRANAVENRAAVEALELRDDHRVLDIGFGGGASFPELLRQVGKGRVAGVDPSAEMVERAKRIWAEELGNGRLQVEEAGVSALPFGDGSFDRALAVNSMYFWPDLGAGLREVRRVLGPGGLFIGSCVDPAMLRRVGFEPMGFRVIEPDAYAEAFRAVFPTVEARPTGDKKGTVLVCGRAPSV